MLVDILDHEIFSSLLPSEIENYLLAAHWHEIRREEDTFSIWEYTGNTDSKYRIWLPLDVRLADYAVAVGRLIKTVASAENRSQLQLIEDLDTIAVGDIIRAATWDELNRASSSIPISDGAFLPKRSYNMAQAAAWATIEKRPVFPYRTPSRVTSYMQRLRLGQSERGSYLIKLISPIQSSVSNGKIPLPGVLTAEEQIPFERQVVLNLVRSLDALQRITQETHQRGRFLFEPFQEIVSEGVSANLCEAIVGEEQEIARYRPFEVSVSWSYALRSSINTPIKTIAFPEALIPYIAQAARVFRERNPEDISLSGYVVSLSRSQMAEPGMIRVLGRIDGQARSVRMTLVGEAYNTAIHAHENDLQVVCNGSLIKQGNFYVLQNPQNFQIIGRLENEAFEQSNLFSK
jgi:hypothetical protein